MKRKVLVLSLGVALLMVATPKIQASPAVQIAGVNAPDGIGSVLQRMWYFGIGILSGIATV